MPGSERHLSSAWDINSHICVVKAWIALGRFRRIRPTPLSAEIRTSSLMVLPAALLAEQVAADDHAHDLVGALEDRMHPQVAPEALDRIVHQIAVAAVELQCAVDDR